MLTHLHLPEGHPGVNADGETAPLAAGTRHGRPLIAVMLLTGGALDMSRCGLVVATARHPAPAAGLLAAGVAAAAVNTWTARGCQRGRAWSTWAALLIGVASAPQAAASGFHAPFTIPDAATAVLGVLLSMAVLATVDRPGNENTTSNTRAQSRGEATDDLRRPAGTSS